MFAVYLGKTNWHIFQHHLGQLISENCENKNCILYRSYMFDLGLAYDE